MARGGVEAGPNASRFKREGYSLGCFSHRRQRWAIFHLYRVWPAGSKSLGRHGTWKLKSTARLNKRAFRPRGCSAWCPTCAMRLPRGRLACTPLALANRSAQLHRRALIRFAIRVTARSHAQTVPCARRHRGQSISNWGEDCGNGY